MINVCMIGHEGHGKSSVANAIHADLNVEDPSKKIKKLLTKLAKADVAVLVVSALDGPMQQTQEHIILANALKVKKLVVYVNKVDLLEDPEVLELIELELRDYLTSWGWDNTQIIYGSATLAAAGDDSFIGLPSIVQLEEAIKTVTPEVKEVVSTSYKTFSADLSLLDTFCGGRHTAIKTGYTPSFFFQDETTTGAIETPIAIAPGTGAIVKISLLKIMNLKVGSTFVVREGNKTIGTGTVLSVIN